MAPRPDSGVPAGAGRRPAWRRGAAAFAVFALGCALTTYYSNALHDLADARGAERFRSQTRALAGRIEAQMQAQASLLAAGAGLFEASDHVDRSEWRRFVNSLRLAETYPGMLGLGYATRVTPGGLPALESDLRQVVGRDRRVVPAGARDEYDVVVYLEPLDKRNHLAIGFDMRSDPVRRAALEAAAGSGETRLSGPVALLQEGAESGSQPGLLLVRPVYDATQPRDTMEERHTALLGFVYAPFRTRDLVNAIVSAGPPDFDFRLIDRGGVGASDTVLYEQGSAKGGVSDGRLVQTHAFAFAGRLWVIEAGAPRGYGAEDRVMQERALLAGGIALSIALALLTLVMARTRARARDLAVRMTHDLRESRRRFERMVAGSSDGVWEYDPATRQIHLSSRCMELLGFPAVGSRRSRGWMPRLVHPDERRAAALAFGAMVRGDGLIDMRMRMRRADGEYRWFRARGRAFAGEDGRAGVVSGSLSDVHEDHEARMRESRLLRIIELSPDMFMTFDLEGHPTYLNPAARRMFGNIGAGRLSGASVASVFAQSEVDRVFNEGVPTAYLQDYWEGETELVTTAGEVMPVSQVILSHKTEAGQVEFYSTVMRDISTLRSALADLRRTRERLQRALDGANDGIWERDVSSDTFSTSDRLAEMLGYAPEAMPRTREAWAALVHPDERPVSDAAVQRMLGSTESVVWDTRMLTGNGTYRWMRRRGRAVRDAQGHPTATAGTLSDIHDARMAEQALRELQARYQRVLDGSNDGIWEMDEAAGLYYCSARLGEILGWSAADTPRTRAEVRARVHPDDNQIHSAEIGRMHESTAAHSWDVRLRHADGSFRWIRFRGISSRDAQGRVVMSSGTASDIHEARLAEDELRRHRDNLAQLVEERTAGLDSARREAEAQRARAEASRETAERASMAKSEFLANMSHELRTPMHAIISFASFGVDRHGQAERDKLLHYFRNIQKSGSRLLTLLNDLLDLSKLEAGKMHMELAPASPAALIGEAVGESEAFALGRGVRLRTTIGADIAIVRWDAARLLQVLRNLISNAVKFSPPDAEVLVSATLTGLRTGRRGGDPILPGIEIRVRDDGIGIPPGELEAVFDKFVQSSKTKTGAGGTGLGLAICREIVLAHGGTIHAENNPAPGAGATFIVRLPAEPDPAHARLQDRGPAEVAA